MSATRPGQPGPTRVVRVIARLNIGGPAIQAITLTQRLESLGYRTVLVHGREEPDEGDMNYLADELGVAPLLITSLRRNPGWRDILALVALIRVMRRERPQVVHTHAAKAGTLGRLAALIAGLGRGPKPILIHTFHGHSLTGYFSSRTAAVYRWIERLLASQTDVLIAVSDEVRDELVRLGVAEPARFAVVPLGFDLRPFAIAGADRTKRGDRLRAELGISRDEKLVTLIARLVPIKRVDRFLRVAVDLVDQRRRVHFLVVGDGVMREQLQASPEAMELDGRLTWAGFRRDIPDVCFASDAVVLTSDNEGTPVSLIEARAAGTPVVSTRVGGVTSVAHDGAAGFVVDPNDERGLAIAIRTVLDDAAITERAAASAASVTRDFSLDALVDRLDQLYRRALSSVPPV
jgi:glycosyltransferase involved in cell wall biosynthesis